MQRDTNTSDEKKKTENIYEIHNCKLLCCKDPNKSINWCAKCVWALIHFDRSMAFSPATVASVGDFSASHPSILSVDYHFDFDFMICLFFSLSSILASQADHFNAELNVE